MFRIAYPYYEICRHSKNSKVGSWKPRGSEQAVVASSEFGEFWVVVKQTATQRGVSTEYGRIHKFKDGEKDTNRINRSSTSSLICCRWGFVSKGHSAKLFRKPLMAIDWPLRAVKILSLSFILSLILDKIWRNRIL
jgi:hypothetical protein